MTRYQVVYTEQFYAGIRDHVDYLQAQGVAAQTITAWYDELFEKVDSLNEWPLRFPVDGIQTRLTGRETRKLNHGHYLVFYQVDLSDQRVEIASFRHAARDRR